MRFSLLAIFLASTAIVGCSDDAPAPAKVFLRSQLGPGTDVGVNGSAECKLTTQRWLDLGKSEASVENASKQGEANVGVVCSVVPEGDGYRVAASATLSPGGTVSITGLLRSSGAQTGITGSFTRADTGNPFRDKNCTVEYTTKDMGVGPGMVWGKLSCPHADQSGNGDVRTCLGVAEEFRFENCDK